jgi:Na+-translocating ferredoxin:NAD+ oxidoreductase subunit B
MSEEVYVRLRHFLDNLPGGFPETPTGVEIRLLKKMFTPEQAEFVMKLSVEPESLSTIAGRTGMKESELEAILEDLAMKGLIFRVYKGEDRLYQAYHFVIGLYEFQVNRIDKEFSELMEEYMPYVAIASARYTRQYRVIPVDSAVSKNTHVEPYNRIREIVRNEDLISLTTCICKKEQGLMGHKCDKPHEVCLMFGNFARFYIDNGYGRSISPDEALNVLDLAEKSGLVLTCSNSQKIETLCCCCTCCCPTVKNIKNLRSPAKFMVSYFRAIIDPDICISCGMCSDTCPMTAIVEGTPSYQVLEKRCIGCGLCVEECLAGALSLSELEVKKDAPMENVENILDRLSHERGMC